MEKCFSKKLNFIKVLLKICKSLCPTGFRKCPTEFYFWKFSKVICSHLYVNWLTKNITLYIALCIQDLWICSTPTCFWSQCEATFIPQLFFICPNWWFPQKYMHHWLHYIANIALPQMSHFLLQSLCHSGMQESDQEW